MPGVVETQQADQCVWSRVSKGTVWERSERGPRGRDGQGEHRRTLGDRSPWTVLQRRAVIALRCGQDLAPRDVVTSE